MQAAVAKWLPLHPMAAKQLKEAPWKKGDIQPLPLQYGCKAGDRSTHLTGYFAAGHGAQDPAV